MREEERIFPFQGQTAAPQRSPCVAARNSSEAMINTSKWKESKKRKSLICTYSYWPPSANVYFPWPSRCPLTKEPYIATKGKGGTKERERIRCFLRWMSAWNWLGLRFPD